MLHEQVPEAQNRGLVGQSIKHAVELGELTQKRHVVQRLFHRGIAQAEPLLHATDIQVYFCDPQSPWQRGSNENTNGLLTRVRQLNGQVVDSYRVTRQTLHYKRVS
jgi:IS30 family transposase